MNSYDILARCGGSEANPRLYAGNGVKILMSFLPALNFVPFPSKLPKALRGVGGSGCGCGCGCQCHPLQIVFGVKRVHKPPSQIHPPHSSIFDEISRTLRSFLIRRVEGDSISSQKLPEKVAF